MRRPSRATLIKAGVLAAVAVVVIYLAARQVHVGETIDRGVAFFRERGPLAFFSAMALLPIVGVPLSPFTLVAGPVFGPTMGLPTVIACALLAVAVNVALSYWIAAYALRPLMSRLVQRLGYQLPDIPPRAAWTATLLLRIVPGTPFPVQNYLLGLARVPFGMYMLISTVVPAAYLIATILLGDGLARHDRGAIIWAVVLFLAAGGVLHQVRRRFSRKAK